MNSCSLGKDNIIKSIVGVEWLEKNAMTQDVLSRLCYEEQQLSQQLSPINIVPGSLLSLWSPKYCFADEHSLLFIMM